MSEICESYGYKLFLTSASKNFNVDTVFNEVITAALARYETLFCKFDTTVLDDHENKKSKSKCQCTV